MAPVQKEADFHLEHESDERALAVFASEEYENTYTLSLC